MTREERWQEIKAQKKRVKDFNDALDAELKLRATTYKVTSCKHLDKYQLKKVASHRGYDIIVHDHFNDTNITAMINVKFCPHCGAEILAVKE